MKKLHLYILISIVTTLFVYSFVTSTMAIKRNFDSVALTRLQTTAKLTETIRQWVAEKGGVYVKASADSEPNEYLKDMPLRDIQVNDTTMLTLFNPAYVTRQFNELFNIKHDILTLRLVSLNPLRPANMANEWETKVLESFEKPTDVFFEKISDKASTSYRYMIPFYTKQSCLSCHAKDGYKLGDIRGGLSIETLDDSQEEMMFIQIASNSLMHLLLFAVLIVTLLLFNYRHEKLIKQTAEGEEKLKFITENSSGWVIMFDDNETLTYISPGLTKYLGYPADFFITFRQYTDLIHPSYKSYYMSEKGMGDANHMPEQTIVYKIASKLGTHLWVEDVIKRNVNSEDNVISTIISSRDISDRMSMLKRIKENESRLNSIFNTAPLGFCLTDGYGAIILSNSWFEQRFTNEENRVVTSIFEVFEDKRIVKELFEQLATNEIATANYETTGDGDTRNYEVLMSTISSGSDDDEQKFLCVLIDNTEKKKTELLIRESQNTYQKLYEEYKDLNASLKSKNTEYQELNKNYLSQNQELKTVVESLKVSSSTIQANELKLKELNDTKDKFFSIIAHDLKNPMATVLGLSELLYGNIEMYDTEKIKSFIGSINNVSKMSYALLENLLEWSRIQTGKLKPILTPTRLATLMYEEVELSKNVAANKNVSINLSVDDQIMVTVDQDMIRTVIRNLVSNAIKFSFAKSTVFVSATNDSPGSVIISVRDQGVGISTEQLHKIFDIDNSMTQTGTADEKGTGLGLILCKEFVEKNGGTIWVESSVNAGSTFFVKLPS